MSRNPFVKHGLARMEGYAMDTDIDITVNAGSDPADQPAEEPVAEETDDSETEEELEEEIETGTKELLLMLETLDQYESFYKVVETHGASRPVIEIMLGQGIDPSVIGVTTVENVPQCENFSIVSSPRMPESVACLEGIGEKIKQVGAWVIEQLKKLSAWFARVLDFTGRKMIVMGKQIKQIEASLTTHTLNPESANVEVKAYTDSQMRSIMEAFKKVHTDNIFRGSEIYNQQAAPKKGGFEPGVYVAEYGEFNNRVKAIRALVGETMGSDTLKNLKPTVFLDNAKDMHQALTRLFERKDSILASHKKNLQDAKDRDYSTKTERQQHESYARAQLSFNTFLSKAFFRVHKAGINATAKMLKTASQIIKKGYTSKHPEQHNVNTKNALPA